MHCFDPRQNAQTRTTHLRNHPISQVSRLLAELVRHKEERRLRFIELLQNVKDHIGNVRERTVVEREVSVRVLRVPRPGRVLTLPFLLGGGAAVDDFSGVGVHGLHDRCKDGGDGEQ